MQSEDALAAVLGHEAEHVDLRHCAEREQTEAALRHLDPTGLLSLPVELSVAGYSKTQESEADRDGTTLAIEAGYSPLGIVQLVQEFARLEGHRNEPLVTPVDKAANLTLASLMGYFQSHPPAVEREAQIRRLIVENHWPTPALTPLPHSVHFPRK